VASGSFSDEDFRQWLRMERNSRGWNREQLAQEIARNTASSISASSIAKIEQGSMSPSGKTKRLIYATLGEPASQVPDSEYPTVQHIWTDGFDVHHLYSEMMTRLKNGIIKYEIGPAFFSIPAYISYNESSRTGLQMDIILARDSIFNQIWTSIYPELDEIDGIDIISLSIGYGWSEIDLAIHFQEMSRKSVNLFFLSCSISVLNEARNQFMKRSNLTGKLRCYTVSGIHELLPSYQRPPLKNPKRRRIIVLPSVLTNHDSDILLWDSVSLFALPGDLMIVDMPLACTQNGNPDSIYLSDPRLNGSLSNDPCSGFPPYMTIGIKEFGHFSFVSSYYAKMDHSRSFKSLSAYCVSHYIELVSDVGPSTKICDIRFSRYEIGRITSYLRHMNWSLWKSWTFGLDMSPSYPIALLLFKRY